MNAPATCLMCRAPLAGHPPAVIPSYTAAVTNLPDGRRRAFRDELTRLISRATAGRDDPAVPAEPDVLPPGAAAVLGRACALCHGDCCKQGGDHAYLTEAT